VAVVFPRAQGRRRVRDAAAIGPTVSEPMHHHAISAGTHAGGIRKSGQAFQEAGRDWLAASANELDKADGSA
jgi:hypothetical protein